MSNLPFKRYVRVTSGAIGQGGTVQRELIGRLFTTNPRMDADEVLEFSNAAAVGRYFGFASQEYLRAVKYFGWLSPTLNTARSLSYARYVPQEVAPMVFGGTPSSLDVIRSMGTTASLSLTIGGTTYTPQAIDVATDITTYADVAAVIQTAVRASSTDTVVTEATVTFDALAGAFNLVAGLDGNSDISVNSSPLSDAVGWTVADGMITTSGHVQQSPVESIQLADSISNNYASVAFLAPLSLQQHLLNAQALQAIDDTSYVYCVPVLASDLPTWPSAMGGVPGVAMTLVSDDDDDDDDGSDYAEMAPMIMMAATNYNDRNATFGYMYREFDFPVTVTQEAVADACDAARVNYYGRTQEAGRTFSFYQKGYLMGPNTAPLDQSVYANEVWLKSRARVLLMDLLRSQPELPANETGRLYGSSTLHQLIDEGLRNGVISVGKTLDNLQRAAVTTLSADGNAWRQVENVGYWLDVVITSKTNEAGVREYTLEYLLIYSKKDVIRSINGRHALV